MTDDHFSSQRKKMVRTQLVERGIQNQTVIEAFRNVPRERFVPEEHRKYAYQDRALPTSEGQTISQPYMVASMTQQLQPQAEDRILEIGTGSGYQSAILAEIGARVFTIEREQTLANQAREILDSLGYGEQIQIRVGDGTRGWPEYAPYNGIIVTAGAPSIPDSLKEQLSVGGRLVIPVGNRSQQYLVTVTREEADQWNRKSGSPCVFVPLVGAEGWEESDD